MSFIKALYPHPALLLSTEGGRYLIIADLHIGFESRFAAKGIRIEASITRIKEETLDLIHNHRPDQLILLGDIKFGIDTISGVEWHLVPEYLEAVSAEVDTIVVPGNHDGNLLPLLPRRVQLVEGLSMRIGENILLHGHTRPTGEMKAATRFILGHIHPTYRRKTSPLAGAQVWLFLQTRRRHIFQEGDDRRVEVVVIPAFNRELAAAGFPSTTTRIISPLLNAISEHIHGALITTLEGDLVGDVEAIRYVL